MSKKKKLAEQAAYERQMENQRPKGPTASFKVMNNSRPVPVARPADHIQLTPIVQPLSLVPYSSQTQPLAMFDDDED